MLLLILLKFTEEYIISLRKMTTSIPTLKMEMTGVEKECQCQKLTGKVTSVNSKWF